MLVSWLLVLRRARLNCGHEHEHEHENENEMEQDGRYAGTKYRGIRYYIVKPECFLACGTQLYSTDGNALERWT